MIRSCGLKFLHQPEYRAMPKFDIVLYSYILARGAGGVHVFLVGALEVLNGALVEVPDACCNFVDEVVIVGDEQHRAFILLKRDIEGIDGFEVEMVRRLVEDQDIWLLKHELAEEQARGFSARERVGGLETLFTTEEHLPEDAANLFLRDLGVPLMEPVGDGETVLDHAGVVLGEVADLGFVTPLDAAGVESEVLFSEIGRGREQGLDERSFAQAVAAHERDLLSAHDVSAEAGDDGLVAVALLNTFKLERCFAGGTKHVEANVGALDVGTCKLGGLQALDFFLAAGNLA